MEPLPSPPTDPLRSAEDRPTLGNADEEGSFHVLAELIKR